MSIRRLVKKIVFPGPGASTVDYKFTDGSFSYLGTPINTIFNEISIRNLSNHDCYFSIETDITNSITVNSSATEGVSYLAKYTGTNIIEADTITRLRVTLTGSGNIEVHLYNNPRTFIR